MMLQAGLLCTLIAASASLASAQRCNDKNIMPMFSEIYMKTLKNYAPYNVVFNTSYSTDDAAQILYDAVYYYAQLLGLPDDQAQAAAQGVQQAATATFGKLTPCMLGMVYGVSVANYSIANGAVKCSNYKTEATSYGNTAIGSFATGFFDNNIQSLATGFVGYLTSIGLFSGPRFKGIGGTFSDALYSVAATKPSSCH